MLVRPAQTQVDEVIELFLKTLIIKSRMIAVAIVSDCAVPPALYPQSQ
jgi:hypothetical protein